MKKTWRIVRDVLHAAGRQVVVRILVGLLAALGFGEIVTAEPVLDGLVGAALSRS